MMPAEPVQLGWFRARLVRFDLSVVLGIAAVGFLIFLVVNPVLRLLVSSFQDTDSGAMTLANYGVAYGHARDWIALGNSILYGVTVTVLATLIAVPLAWAVSRTDMPGKGLVRTMILGAFITPPYLGAIGWILLAGPNAGWLNRIWMALTGTDSGLFNIYSFGGLVLVTALYAFPYVFVFTSDALDLVSSEMEEAANILGAPPLRTIFRITLPLVMPAAAAAFWSSDRIAGLRWDAR
jgi:iron(III) transport system permease protein